LAAPEGFRVLATGVVGVLMWPAPVSWGLYFLSTAVAVGVLAAGQRDVFKKHV
jgi:hypothetical protein